ncbi:hypothetical protein [Peptostreptococcus sp.]|jgi:hypothetical protein|nr:MAG TPA: Flagellar assembly protein T, C-terminal domain [Caudoviricetes sp.]
MFVKNGYKVIKILSNNELIINYGIDDGAKIAQKVRIYIPGEEIIDPKTEFVLGTLDTIKDELEIYETFDQFSICRKVQRQKRNVLTPFAVDFVSELVSYDQINVNESEISPVDRPAKSPICVGDLVKIIA